MKIAIAATDNHIDAFVDRHFGRCEWYCIFDTQTNNYEFIPNTAFNLYRIMKNNLFFLINLLIKEMNHLLRLIIFSQVVNILSLCYLYFF